MKKALYRLIPIIVFFLFCFSCSPFAPEMRSLTDGTIPAHFSINSNGPELPSRWWEDFNDPELNKIINEILSENLSIKQAWSRLKQADAKLEQKGSILSPDLSVISEGSYTRKKTTTEAGQTTGGIQNKIATKTKYHETIENYSFGFSSSYELDLWGKIHSDIEASRLDRMATREDLNTSATTLVGQAVETWINILARRLQKQLLYKQLETNETYLELVELRFKKGLVSALDVYQQREVIAHLKAQLPLLESQEQQLMHSLAALMSKPPKYPIEISRKALPKPGAIPAMGIPADILERRPDIIAAELKLYSADWQVAVARADRLPTFNLSASALYDANKFNLIFDNWILNLTGSLIAPILDGKKRVSEIEYTKAVVEERISAYREKVLNAVKEVEDAILVEEKQREYIMGLESQLVISQKALREASERYIKGLNEYLTVLNQILSVQGLEQDILQAQTELLINRTTLYRALGGTWTRELMEDDSYKDLWQDKEES